MQPIDPQVAQQLRDAAGVVRRKLQQVTEQNVGGDERTDTQSELDICRVGLTLFCNSFFELRHRHDSCTCGNHAQEARAGDSKPSE